MLGLSLVVERKLWAHGLQQVWSRDLLLWDRWNPPRPGKEPMAPVLQGEFLTGDHQGSPQCLSLYLAQNNPEQQHSCLGSDVIDFH